jgi:hypothetical protein
VLAFEPMRGQRAVATPAALDAALADKNWGEFESPVSRIRPSSPVALRIAPDEVLVLGAGAVGAPDLTVPGDEHAIVVDEAGFSGRWLSWDEYERLVAPYVEWPLPTERPALAQGRVAGVPAKLWCTADDVLLLVATAYAHDLSERLV